ncbi:MAG: hypothetical protein Q8P81_03220 [Nanoarchaeota archaeon]|nr:hypothetical protein [Nanoarchaeota archaeon]
MICKKIKYIIKYVFVLVVITFVGFYGYYKLYGIWDSELCDLMCRWSTHLPHDEQEERVIGVYKYKREKCHCYVVRREKEEGYIRIIGEETRYRKKEVEKK